MSEYKSKRNWINNAPLTIVDLGSLHPPASGSLLVTTATACKKLHHRQLQSCVLYEVAFWGKMGYIIVKHIIYGNCPMLLSLQ